MSKAVHRVPRVSSKRETLDFDNPMVPLGHGDWRRASECDLVTLKTVIEKLSKHASDWPEEYNRKVLAGAKNQYQKMGGTL